MSPALRVCYPRLPQSVIPTSGTLAKCNAPLYFARPVSNMRPLVPLLGRLGELFDGNLRSIMCTPGPIGIRG